GSAPCSATVGTGRSDRLTPHETPQSPDPEDHGAEERLGPGEGEMTPEDVAEDAAQEHAAQEQAADAEAAQAQAEQAQPAPEQPESERSALGSATDEIRDRSKALFGSLSARSRGE